jgi:phosphoglycolate phosphatase
MRRQLGMPELPSEVVCEYVGFGLRKLVENCLQSSDPDLMEKAAKIYSTHYGEHLLDTTRLYPDALIALDYFKECAQVVITNKPEPYSSRILKDLGVAGRFLDVVAGDEVYPKKPSPESTRAMLSRFSVRPAEAVFIGDSPVDVQTGMAAGIEVVGVAHGFVPKAELQKAGPHYLVDHFEELLRIAKKNGW